MTSPLSVTSAGSLFTGLMREYSSLGWAGARVVGISSILSIRPSSIAAMRTFRANGEPGENASFIGYSFFFRHCEPTGRRKAPPDDRLREAIHRAAKEGWIASSLALLAMTRLAMHSARRISSRDDFLPLFAEPLDAERDHVADIEEFWRLHAGTDARRRAGGDDVARQQRQELRDVGNAFRHRKDHGGSRSGLTALAVDIEAHRQFLHVRYLVLGHQPGSERTEGVVRLALGPLTQTLDLEIALGYVVTDAVAGDVVERVGLGYVLGAGADDGGDFDFPVEFCGAARLLHRIVGAAQRGVGLQEEDRFGWDLRAGLLGVINVVQADGDEFRNAGHRRADPWLTADRRKLGGVEGSEFGQRGRRIGLAVEVPHMIRQIAQLTRFIDQTGLFLANRPVTNKLHFSLLPDVVFVASMLHGTARGEIQLLRAPLQASSS